MKINIDQVRDLESKVAKLYDIKTLSQAISNKGWACISQDKQIAKSSVPTLKADLQSKRNDVDKSMSWELISSNGIDTSNEIYSQVIKGNDGWYYCIRSRGNRLGKTKTFTYNSFTDLSDENFENVWFFEKITNSYALIKGDDRMLLLNLDTDTISTVYNNGGWAYDNFVKVIDNKIVFGFDSTYWAYCDINDIATISTSMVKVARATSPIPYYKIGNYWFGQANGSVYRGTQIDSLSSWKGGWVYGMQAMFAINNTTLGVVDGWHSRNLHYVDIETGDISTTIDVSNYFGTYGVIYDRGYSINGVIYAGQNYSLDGGNNWISLPINGQKSIIDNFLEFVTDRDHYGRAYRGTFGAVIYTDTINGVNQQYYFNSTYKMKFAVNTTNKSSIVSYLGYWNYFYVEEDTNITLPQNNNLWTMMYVGDDYQESSVPSGNINKKANVLYGTSAPATSTVGTIGDIYIDTTNVAIYILAGISGDTYTWKQVSVVA